MIAFIDPGPEKHGWCIINRNPVIVVSAGHDADPIPRLLDSVELVGIEKVVCYGQVTGASTMETAFQSGALFARLRLRGYTALRPSRPEIAQALTGIRSANKSKVWQCLCEEFSVEQLGPLAPRKRGACVHARDAFAGCIYLLRNAR